MNERILIVEDEAIIAEDISDVLQMEGYAICGVEATCESALHAFVELKPDLVISDIYLGTQKTGIDFVKEISEICPVPVIFITAYSNDEIIRQLSGFVNISYLTKPFTNIQLLASVKMAAMHLPFIEKFSALSHREMQIAKMLANGCSSKEVAEQLFISVETVKTHRKNIFIKLETTNVAQLISLIKRHF